MFLDFEKWHGTENDFMVVWISETDGDIVLGSLKKQAKKLCDRRSGIGADGILVLHTHRRGDLNPVKLSIINSDGSLAKNCGNGLRCAALSFLKAHMERGNLNDLPDACVLDVEGASLVCSFFNNKTLSTLVSVEMASAKLGAAVPWGKVALQAADKHIKSLTPALKDYELSVVDLGNPHLVVKTESASRDLMLRIGPALQNLCGIDGINVHVVKQKNLPDSERSDAKRKLGQDASELFEMYVWERGAGETKACGTGACAVAVSALVDGLIDRAQWVAVDMPGGRVFVKQDDPDYPVTLAGPASFVFAGKFEL